MGRGRVLNIFIVDYDPRLAAQMLCDQHVVNQPNESFVMLAGRGWHHHKCTVWTWESLQNYEWHLRHAIEMCHEYTRRYGKVHVHQDFFEWAWQNLYELGLSDNGLTPFALATGPYVLDDPIETYRYFYRETKTWARWLHSEEPHWWQLEYATS